MKGISRRIILGGLTLPLLLAFLSHAELPKNFRGWETTKFQVVVPSGLALLAGEDAPVLVEYGFVTGQRREYARGDSKLTVTLWKMKDASGAFGLWTFYQERGMTNRGEGDSLLAGTGRWLARRGVYVLEARGADLAEDEARSLLGEVPRLRPSQEILPSLPAYLPQENLAPYSAKFLMGRAAFERVQKDVPSSWIGFELGAEAAVAQYRAGGDDLRLLLVSYATPQLAAKKLRGLQDLPATPETRTLHNAVIQRKGSLLCFVFEAGEQAAAERLLDAIRYESVVTWNERVPSRRDNIGNLIMAVVFLTGFLLLVAFVAGVSFGGLRLLAKRFLPWSVFDRPEQMEIIQLRLSGR